MWQKLILITSIAIININSLFSLAMRIKLSKRSIFLFFFCATIISIAHAQEKNLDYFINAALQNSPLLKDYSNQVLLNSIDSARIRAGYRPQVNGKSTNLYAPVVSGWGYDEAITNIGNFSELLTVDKQIINK